MADLAGKVVAVVDMTERVVAATNPIVEAIKKGGRRVKSSRAWACVRPGTRWLTAVT
jgi:hypothetical protein